MIDLQKVREKYGHTPGGRYICDGIACRLCAIEALCREVERLRQHECPDIEAQQDEAMEAFRRVEWEPKPDRPIAPAAYACPGCDIDDGWSGTDSERERVYPSEPDWLPAPDTMPPDLAPAQMVEIDAPAFEDVCRADCAPWGKHQLFEYHPLYSDTGEVLCSAEGLEEWARFVATDEDGKIYQYDCHVSHDAEEWYPTNRGKWSGAPESHRKPGDWRDSLMEVMR